MIMWIIGLSGAGKSTLAEAIVAEVRRKTSTGIAVVDGDVMREVWGDNLGHDLQGRQINADRLCRFCLYLESQNINAICPILSIFPQSREWNRQHLKNYYELYLKTPIEVLIERDGKGLYKRALNNETELPGINIYFPEPDNPDETIDNTDSRQTLVDHAARLANLFIKS